jgi:hypothetical protein
VERPLPGGSEGPSALPQGIPESPDIMPVLSHEGPERPHPSEEKPCAEASARQVLHSRDKSTHDLKREKRQKVSAKKQGYEEKTEGH